LRLNHFSVSPNATFLILSMGDTIELEAGTQLAKDYVNGFFSAFPVDSRFTKIAYQKCKPNTGLEKDSQFISFTLEKKDPPMCYMIAETMLECRVQIVKSDFTVPVKTVNVGPVNNPLHSLFESVSMELNLQSITNSSGGYPYKAYLNNLLTFDAQVKTSTLESQGWSTDTKDHMEGDTTNSGFLGRSYQMRKNVKSVNDYRPEGNSYIGLLFHELSNCRKPLPPGVAVHFNFQRSSNDFYIMKSGLDNDNYKAVISDITLYVPVAHMQMAMLNELNLKWPTEPIKYHSRRLVVHALGIHRNKMDFITSTLFVESENPVRVFLMIVEASALNGMQTKNPFSFYRKWTDTSSQLSNFHEFRETSELKSEMRQLKGMLEEVMSRITPRAEEPIAGASGLQAAGSARSMIDRMKNKLSSFSPRRRSTADTESEFDVISEQDEIAAMRRELDVYEGREHQAAAEEGVEADPKYFWLTKCQLLLGEEPLGNT